MAPDKFKGSLTASEVADALTVGMAAAAPRWDVVRAPVADGGEGSVAAVLASGWEPVTVPTTGPTGEPLWATYARRGRTVVVELASAAGLGTLPDRRRRPLQATTHGLGALLWHALDAGADEIIVGLGGSATTDGGAGLLTGLGARVLDADGMTVAPGGVGLSRAESLDLDGLHPRARTARFVFACDVDNPLTGPEGAAAVYGPQKGAGPEEVRVLDAALARWARLLRRHTGRDVADAAGAGAAGGALCGAAAVLDVTLRGGAPTIFELVGLDRVLAGADLVVTGEGRLDQQSLRGKAPVGVAMAALDAGARVVAVAGTCELTPEELRAAGISDVFTLVVLEPDVSTAIATAPRLLRHVGRAIAVTEESDR